MQLTYILDKYSRAIVASAPSKKQDLWAFLLVFFTAIHVHGAPEALVSDGGTVFKAGHALEIYGQLGIKKEQIEHRKPWQDYVETHLYVIWNTLVWYTGPSDVVSTRRVGEAYDLVSGSRTYRMVSLPTSCGTGAG